MYIIKKVNIYVIKNIKLKIVLCLIALFSIITITACNRPENNNTITTTQVINTKDYSNDNTVFPQLNPEPVGKLNLDEYKNMPEKIDGYKVVGEIIIPKINIEKYILEETTSQALKKYVTKICGPEINKVGNFCIAGHNYNNIFGKINLLEIGDEIQIKDTYDRVVNYQVYKKETVSAYNTNCLSQETNNEREITLVTCTFGAIKRIVIKAIEIYD